MEPVPKPVPLAQYCLSIEEAIFFGWCAVLENVRDRYEVAVKHGHPRVDFFSANNELAGLVISAS